MVEEWRESVGGYQISNIGRVKRPGGIDSSGHQRNERILKPFLSSFGYFRVGLYINGTKRKYAVHRLVASAFCPGECDGLQVNHKDGNKQNNNADNLEWITARENQLHAFKLGLKRAKINNPSTSKRVAQYTKSGELVKIYPSSKEAERETGFLRSNICTICRKEKGTVYGYKWRYVDG